MEVNHQETIDRLTAEIAAAGAEATAAMFIERGKAYWSLGDWRRATNDYLAADGIAPNAEAATLLELTSQIIAYRNTDLLNP